jgi:hypothetical protein
MRVLKKRMEHLELGLDPRVVRLFKGKVIDYDARTRRITLVYDFKKKGQTEDFIGSKQEGLTWRKGVLRLEARPGSKPSTMLQMPQFLSGTLTVRLSVKHIHKWGKGSHYVSFHFHTPGSKGTGERLSLDVSGGGNTLRGTRSVLVRKRKPVLLTSSCEVELSCQGRKVLVTKGGQPVLEHTLSKPNGWSGFSIGGQYGSYFTLMRMQISGRLDPSWLAAALARAPGRR